MRTWDLKHGNGTLELDQEERGGARAHLCQKVWVSVCGLPPSEYPVLPSPPDHPGHSALAADSGGREGGREGDYQE